MLPLERAILKTIIYFDLFSYPLTAFEVWRWLWMDEVDGSNFPSVTLAEIVSILEESPLLREKITFTEGFYHLSGRHELVAVRQRRYVIAERKFRKTVRMTKLLAVLPFIRFIGVCNNLAFSNARDESDIDLFIITEPGKVWTARFWVAGMLKLFGLRPRQDHSRDTFCVSFFLSAGRLSVRSVALEEGDPYLTHWTPQVVPIYDAAEYGAQFAAANQWVREHLPNAFAAGGTPRRMIRGSRIIQRMLEILCEGVRERGYRRYQERILPETLRQLVNRDQRHVVMNEWMIKLYTHDRRGTYREQFVQAVSQAGG